MKSMCCLLALGLLSAAMPAMADPLVVPPALLAGLDGLAARQTLKMYTMAAMPGLVVANETARLARESGHDKPAPLGLDEQHSLLKDCPDTALSLDMKSQSIFVRNLDNTDQPMSAHVNTIVGLPGCSPSMVVEFNILYEPAGNEPGAVKLVIDHYLLGVTRD